MWVEHIGARTISFLPTNSLSACVCACVGLLNYIVACQAKQASGPRGAVWVFSARHHWPSSVQLRLRQVLCNEGAYVHTVLGVAFARGIWKVFEVWNCRCCMSRSQYEKRNTAFLAWLHLFHSILPLALHPLTQREAHLPCSEGRHRHFTGSRTPLHDASALLEDSGGVYLHSETGTGN